MAFRFKVTKTVQIRQFEPLVIEAEYQSEKAVSEESWQKIADRVEKFVLAQLKQQVRTYKKLDKALHSVSTADDEE